MRSHYKNYIATLYFIVLATPAIAQMSESEPQIRGATDGTLIGNSSDRLKAECTQSGSYAVTGTFWQTTQPVSGTVTANAGTGTFAISAASLPLPTGASTSALQTTGNTSLSSIDTKLPALVSGRVPVDGSGVIQPISVTDTNPATQTITALDTNTSTFVGANSQAFYTGTPTTNSAAVFALSSVDTVVVQSTLIGTGGTLLIETSMDGGTFWTRPTAFQPGTQSYGNAYTAPFDAVIGVAGMTHMRVRSSVSWSGTATILIHGSLNLRAMILGEALPPGGNTIGSLNNISGTISLPTGAATSANQSTIIASLASIDAGTPAALGQTTMSASSPVTLASDQSTIPVKETLTSGGVYGNLSVGTSAVEIKVGGSRLTARRSVTVMPIDEEMWWGYSNSVTTSNGTPIFKSQLMVFQVDATAPIYLISDAASKNARISESP